MAISLDKLFGIHETALGLRAQRTEVLASNLANADTPGYKARDLDFRTTLAVYEGMREPLRLTRTNHLTGGQAFDGSDLLYRTPTQPSIDGNTVDSEREKAAFLENALQYQSTLRFIDGAIKTMRGAIRGE